MLLNRVLRAAYPTPAATPNPAPAAVLPRIRTRIRPPRPVSAGPAPEPSPSDALDARTGHALPDGFLIGVVARQDAVPQQSRLGTEHVHVSSLASLCPRAYAIADTYPDALADASVTGGHKVMWRIGRAVERHFRDSFIDAGGAAWGSWRCACRATLVTGGTECRTQVCEACNQPTDVYQEFTLYDDDAMVAGNPDLLVDLGLALLPVEIKSMKAEQWGPLTAPLPDHLFQVQSYRKLMGLAGLPLTPVSAVVYITKDFRFGSPYKEFHVLPDPTIDAMVDEAWANADTLRHARESRTIPRRLAVCQSATSPRARACPVVGQCMLRSNA